MSHLLKPQLGEIPAASGIIDMNGSVDNEHCCLTLLEEFGLEVDQTCIETFGKRRVLAAERSQHPQTAAARRQSAR